MGARNTCLAATQRVILGALLGSPVVAGCAEARLFDAPGESVMQAHPAATAPSPESLYSYADRLPPCLINAGPLVPEREAVVPAASAILRLPATYREDMESRIPAGGQRWVSADNTSLSVSVVSSAGQFYIGGGPSNHLAEGSCALRVAAELAPVSIYRLVPQQAGRDTLFVATIIAPVRSDLWIGAGILSPSRRGRAEGLRAFQTLEFRSPPPERGNRDRPFQGRW
jgi:hypothetical protein